MAQSQPTMWPNQINLPSFLRFSPSLSFPTHVACHQAMNASERQFLLPFSLVISPFFLLPRPSLCLSHSRLPFLFLRDPPPKARSELAVAPTVTHTSPTTLEDANDLIHRLATINVQCWWRVQCAWPSCEFKASCCHSPDILPANLGAEMLSTLPYSKWYPSFPTKVPRSSACISVQK